VWIGGAGEQVTLRIVAKYADCSNFGGDRETWARKRKVLEGHCAAVGRDVDEIRSTWSPELLIRETEAEVTAAAGARAGDEAWRSGNLIGTPEQVAEKIASYAELGLAGVIPWCVDYPGTETMTRFAEQVIPNFR
jgi:alkanesulfonate monooxygenase SsuD/methylene tetrahydromethanopterin reductase-like flavin-dependent oxidoreductase (luciferase family)